MKAFLVLLLLTSCGQLAWDGDPSKCDWVVDGACFVHKEDIFEGYTQEESKRVLELALDYWKLPHSLAGWMILVQRSPVSCYGFGPVAGCARLDWGEIIIMGYETCPFGELPHELGHVAHNGDPFHEGGGYYGAGHLLGRCTNPDLE